jgi:hypothetical protein
MEREMNPIFEDEVSKMISNFQLMDHAWFNGTLFYKCETEDQARAIWHHLSNHFESGSVQLSRYEDQYAYIYAVDFV